MHTVDRIVLHCTDTYADMDIGVREVRGWHKAKGWSDIGYHFLLRRDGTWEQGRYMDEDNMLDDNEVGAHALGYNRSSVGLAIVGGKGIDGTPLFNYTEKQIAELVLFVKLMTDRFSLQMRDVYGHNQLSEKACPCFSVPELLSSVK